MKWIKITVIAAIGVLAAALFALSGQKVELDAAAQSAIGPEGDVYLLSREGSLIRISPDGYLRWEASLPTREDGGILVRYGNIAVDRNGGICLSAQKYRRIVDAGGAVVEVVQSEEVQAWNSRGDRVGSLFSVDKTALSQYSTEDYILELEMHADVLLALCRDQGRLYVIELDPYDGRPYRVLSSAAPGREADEIQDCAGLSDGTFVFSTAGGGLMAVSPDGQLRDYRALLGEDFMAGSVSSDETDRIYVSDRYDGALYAVDPAGNSVTRLYNAGSVILEAEGRHEEVTLRDVREIAAAGDGSFKAVSVDTERPFWVRFGRTRDRLDSARRGWDLRKAVGTAGVLLGTVLGLWLASMLIGRLGRRSVLISRILLYFLPMLLLVLTVLTGGLVGVNATRARQARRDSLASAARAAAGMLRAEEVTLDDLREKDAVWRGQVLAAGVERAASHAADVSGLKDVGILVYIREEGRCFGVYAASDRDAFRGADFLAPMDGELPADTISAVSELAEEGGSLEFTVDGEKRVSYFLPLTGEDGRVSGLLEARVSGQTGLFAGGLPPVTAIAAVVGIAAAILLLWLLAVLIRLFRPLKDLRRCIGEISAGNWKVRAGTASGDELADISVSFNQMTEKLNQYISGMVMLNNEYIKFTPRELFQLLGKSKVTDLKLRDRCVRDISLLYVNFRSQGAALDSDGYFTLMNDSFDRIFEAVERNRGIIQRFDGSGMTALFPWQVRDALNTAISLKEILDRDLTGVELQMLISADELLVGVAGNEKRQSITAISDTIMDIHGLVSLMDRLGTKNVITEKAVKRISDRAYFNCREIGSGDSGGESLYEFLDGMDPYEKKLHLVTKQEFEKGVRAYRRGEYREARKCFAAVLQVNERDSVAMAYLIYCDSRCHGGREGSEQPRLPWEEAK